MEHTEKVSNAWDIENYTLSLILIFMSSTWNTDLAEASSQQLKTNTGYSRAFVDKIKYNKDVQPYFGPQMG